MRKKTQKAVLNVLKTPPSPHFSQILGETRTLSSADLDPQLGEAVLTQYCLHPTASQSQLT